VERNITTPLEQAIKTSSGVKEYDSFSNDGMSIITVQYEFGTDMKAREAEVQQAVSGVQPMLPATALAPEIGYDAAAAMAKEGFKSGRTIREMALEKGIAPERLDELLDPLKMTEPGLGSGAGGG
jgi:fumarate hydratase class II